MTLKKRVENMLRSNPQSRERKSRYRAIWFILYEIYHYDSIDKEKFIQIGPEIGSINRLINRFQQQDESLRGKDYDDKKKLMQEKQIELGYEVGYHQDIKRNRKFREDDELDPSELSDEPDELDELEEIEKDYY